MNILKTILSTVLVSSFLLWLFGNLGGSLGRISVGIPFAVFSFFFVFYSSYDGSAKNYVYPLLITLGLFFCFTF